MSNYTYLPKPPRAWTRFENSCVYLKENQTNPNAEIYVPILKQTITYAELAHINQLYKKGNILQYKSNSSNLTKQQRYSQIARGAWTNRNTTWASQTDKYSNPNTQSLKRINYGTIPLIAGTENTTGSLCPIIPARPQYNVLPATIIPDPGTEEPPIDPPPEEPPAGEESKLMPPYIMPDEPPESTLIPDGGTLICSQIEDICTGAIIKELSGTSICAPTTASDVPGIIEELCWNDGLSTYYPRVRLTYGTSSDKFPENYKGLVSALKPAAPDLLLASSGTNSDNLGIITLNWEFNDSICIPIDNFLLYENNILIETISYQSRSISLDNLPVLTNLNYILYAHFTTGDSNPSNPVNVYITPS